MEEKKIQLFEGQQMRYVWDEEQEKYFFSVVDVVRVLTDSENPRKYWSVLKTRLKQEGSEMATNCSQLKLPSSDGKSYLTDMAKGFEDGSRLIEKWLNNKSTIDFLGVWEQLYNPNFKTPEFGGIRMEARWPKKN